MKEIRDVHRTYVRGVFFLTEVLVKGGICHVTLWASLFLAKHICLRIFEKRHTMPICCHCKLMNQTLHFCFSLRRMGLQAQDSFFKEGARVWGASQVGDCPDILD